ncbi:hypothetical protein QTP88_009041 [Uroleucon formosanum]
MKNDVNKVNAAFCGMRFQQYRTSLTMFYWKSPFEICGGPVDCFFSIPPRRAMTTDRQPATTALRQTSRRSDVRVGRDLASGDALSGLSLGLTRRRTCGQHVMNGGSHGGHVVGPKTCSVDASYNVFMVNAREATGPAVAKNEKQKTENTTYRL